MTNEEIDALEGGTHLDYLVDSAIFQAWIEPLTTTGEDIASRHDILPHYSTRIQDAWRVVEELHLHVGWYDLGWYASTEHDFNEDDCLISSAETMPMAVCRLALKKAGA